MNMAKQVAQDAAHFAFMKIVSIIERYDEDTQFALTMQCRLLLDWESLEREYGAWVVDKTVFSRYIEDNLFHISLASAPLSLYGTKRDILKRLDEEAFIFPDNLARTKSGTISYQAKYDWCLQHPDIILPIAFPNLVAVRPSALLQKGGKLLFDYVHRKFCDTIYKFSGNRHIQVPCGVVISNFDTLDYAYPEDIVTEMLNYYGHNRCKFYTEPRDVYAKRIAVLHYEFPITDKSVEE